MPHSILWETDGLVRKFSGQVSGEEILKSNFALQANPKFQTIKYIINDFTEVTSHSIEQSHTNVYASTDEIISNEKGKLKIAIVVNQESLIELAKNYQSLMRNMLFECEIFQSVEDSRQWVEND